MAHGRCTTRRSRYAAISARTTESPERWAGRWLQLAYPKSRWIRDRRPPFNKWRAKMTERRRYAELS